VGQIAPNQTPVTGVIKNREFLGFGWLKAKEWQIQLPDRGWIQIQIWFGEI